jgi:pantoate--beta-alanine ligase
MNVLKNIAKIRKLRWQNPHLTWGFVPTMGALHEGHLSLIRAAKKENDRVAVSIFVNPTQFAPHEDLAKYPKQLAKDLALLKKEKVDLVWTPSSAEIYPEDYETFVSLEKSAKKIEGHFRPSHFQGVTTIVTKLFNVIQPHIAYFGQKDAQQAYIIQKMVKDLNFDITIRILPIIRENNGLALSSRNQYLTPAQKTQAALIYQSLQKAKALFDKGQTDANILQKTIQETLNTTFKIDYVKIVETANFNEAKTIKNKAYILIAAHLGNVRLIDNIILKNKIPPP